MPRLPLALSAAVVAFVLAGCTSGEQAQPAGTAPPSSSASPTESAAQTNIANVSQVKSMFGDQFKVTELPPAGIDPKLLVAPPVPPGVRYEPPDCAEFAVNNVVPAGLKGNMAAVTAEGEGNRFIVMAIETSEPVPLNVPGPNCQRIAFATPTMRGAVQVEQTPQIDGVQTTGSHRVVQAVAGNKAATGELYNYVASFDTFLVIVTANPLVVPDKPVTPVNTQRALDLFSAAVAAVKG